MPFHPLDRIAFVGLEDYRISIVMEQEQILAASPGVLHSVRNLDVVVKVQWRLFGTKIVCN